MNTRDRRKRNREWNQYVKQCAERQRAETARQWMAVYKEIESRLDSKSIMIAINNNEDALMVRYEQRSNEGQ